MLVFVAPSLFLGPVAALETSMVLPTEASSAISSKLLPEMRAAQGGAGMHDEPAWNALFAGQTRDRHAPVPPWDWDNDSYLALFVTTGTLWGQPLVSGPPWVSILAVETEAAPVEDDPDELEEGLKEPEPEVGMDPPTEEEAWEPEAAPGASGGPEIPNDPLIEASRTPLPVEQQVGVCVIRGEVSDATTLDPIVGAIVTVVGSGREDETDAQGRFEIGGLPPGDYSVEALKLGYSIATTSASPRPDSPAEVRLALKVKPTGGDEGEFMLAEEVIVGEYEESSQGNFNLDLGAAMSLSSGISAEDFAKENVSDAGEAL
ncbi:MAG: carboxypeptidase-like regulatory domain-containing protein, partial [Verrucomicrobiales bacterium]